MAFQITREWIINLSDDFENRVEENKIIFWKAGVTVVAAVFRIPADTDKIVLLNHIQEKMPEDALEKLVSTRGEIVGLGYTQIMQEEDGKNRLALYTFTASDTSCLQTAYYLDDPDDLPWAKSIWESTVYHPDENNQI